MLRKVRGTAARQDTISVPWSTLLATGGQHGDAALAGALSRALCWVAGRGNKHAGPRPGSSKPLILCLVASDDVPRQYVPIMNAIFAAQRHEVSWHALLHDRLDADPPCARVHQVIIDACILGANDSALLQQAAHLTGGTYFKPPDLSSTLQHLLQSFAVDTTCRQWLQPPALLGVDFRAACFCHKRPCDMVYVCSVCMSIFCEQVADCSTCGTLFKKAAPKVGGLPP
jgi:transcription initiation factor TFIIH subunit 3